MNLTRLTKRGAAAATLCLMTACSSSASKPAGGIGAPIIATSNTAVTTAALGTPIRAGELSMTISGPATTKPDGAGLGVTFQVSMTDTGKAQVKGPQAYAVTCNGASGGWLATSTAGGLTLDAGATKTGTAVVLWLGDNSTAQCKGTTTIDAEFGGFDGKLSWTIPPDQVATINQAAADVAAASPSS